MRESPEAEMGEGAAEGLKSFFRSGEESCYLPYFSSIIIMFTTRQCAAWTTVASTVITCKHSQKEETTETLS